MRDRIIEAMHDSEVKAWEALSGYKFIMFGYHASEWVNYRRLLGERQPNPFKFLVDFARLKTIDNEP